MSLEELVEAASFLHFLEHNSLIHHEDIQQHLRTPDGHLIMYVSPMRYLLGLCDLNGELMRLAINAAACPDPMHVIERVLSMQRAIYDALEPLAPYSYEIRKKQQITLASLRKVEDGMFGLYELSDF